MGDISTTNAVREILVRDWDPVYIGENPNLHDEYDSYISEVIQVASTGDILGLCAYLEHLERDIIRSDTSPSIRLQVASKIVEIVQGRE